MTPAPPGRETLCHHRSRGLTTPAIGDGPSAAKKDTSPSARVTHRPDDVDPGANVHQPAGTPPSIYTTARDLPSPPCPPIIAMHDPARTRRPLMRRALLSLTALA